MTAREYQTFGLLRSPSLEAYEIERGCFLVYGGSVDLRTRSAAVAPPDHSPNRLEPTLEDRLHPTVLCVANPTVQIELFRLALHRISESPFLHDATGDEDVRP